MTILWDRLRELARDAGMVNAFGTGRRAVDRSDEVAQDAVAALDDDMRAKLRAVLLQYSRCTLTDITLAANLAGADRVEVLCSAGEVILCLLDERADMTMVAEVGSEVHRVMAAGVKLFVVIGPAWYPVRSYVEHYAIRGCTDDAIYGTSPLATVSASLRQNAKMFNFGFPGGMSGTEMLAALNSSPNCRCVITRCRIDECPTDVARRLERERPSGPCSRLFRIGTWADASGVAHGVVLTADERNSNVRGGAMLPACRIRATHEVGFGRYAKKVQGVPRELWSVAALGDVTCEGCFPKIERAMLRHARRYG